MHTKTSFIKRVFSQNPLRWRTNCISQPWQIICWNLFKISIIISQWVRNYVVILKMSFFSFQHQASNSKKVYLKAVTLKSTGLYRCEISAEEPDFKTVAGEGKLEVVCKWKHREILLTLLILCTIMFWSKPGLKQQEQQFRNVVQFPAKLF